MDTIRARFGAKFSGPQWLHLDCVLAAGFSGLRRVFPDRNGYYQSAFWVLNFPDRNGYIWSAFWLRLLFRTAACLPGPQWILSECILRAEFSGPQWLHLECVLAALAFLDRGVSSQKAMDTIRRRFGC